MSRIIKTFAALFLSFFFLATLGRAETIAAKYYLAGLQFYEKSQYDDALEKFERATDENFDFWQSYQMIGYCYFYLRQKDNALTAFAESLRLHPDNPKLMRLCDNLKSGALDFPLQPVALNPEPVGTPVVVGPLLSRFSSAKKPF